MSKFQCCMWNDLEADYDEATGKEGPTLMASGTRSSVVDAIDSCAAAEEFVLEHQDAWSSHYRVVVEHETGERDVFEVSVQVSAHRARGCSITPRVGPKEWP